MSLSDSGLKALVPRDKKYRVSVGDALYIIVYPNGGKYFVWRYRFPPDRSGQFRDYQIGPYGKGVGKWSLKQARDEKDRLDQLRKAGEDPRLLKSEAKREVLATGTDAIGSEGSRGVPGPLQEQTQHHQRLPQHAVQPGVACPGSRYARQPF